MSVYTLNDQEYRFVNEITLTTAKIISLTSLTIIINIFLKELFDSFELQMRCLAFYQITTG